MKTSSHGPKESERSPLKENIEGLGLKQSSIGSRAENYFFFGGKSSRGGPNDLMGGPKMGRLPDMESLKEGLESIAPLSSQLTTPSNPNKEQKGARVVKLARTQNAGSTRKEGGLAPDSRQFGPSSSSPCL